MRTEFEANNPANTAEKTGGGWTWIVMVGRRAGKAVINWPGVALVFLIILALVQVGGALFCLALRTPMTPHAMAMGLFGAIMATGIGLARARSTPTERLVVLDTPSIRHESSSRVSRTASVGVTTGIHSVLLLVLGAMLMFWVPHFIPVFLELDAKLPGLTQGVINVSRAMQHGGFLLVPVLMAMDLLLCWLAQRSGGGKLLAVWAALGVLGLVALMGLTAISMFLPTFNIAEQMAAPRPDPRSGAIPGNASSSQVVKEDKWLTKIESVLRQYHTGAELVKEDSVYVYRYRTQTLKLHTVDKTGAISDAAHDEESPEAGGILLKVSLEDGTYQGAAVIPQEVREPYCSTFINAYPVSGGKHILLNLSYGSRADKKLIEAIKTCLGPI